MQRVYLSRRNLITLLNKLGRNRDANSSDESKCTLIKRDTVHPYYPSTDIIEVVAVEDEEYYTDRPAGRVYEADLPKENQ